jgi:hypothetical protein
MGDALVMCSWMELELSVVDRGAPPEGSAHRRLLSLTWLYPRVIVEWTLAGGIVIAE